MNANPRFRHPALLLCILAVTLVSLACQLSPGLWLADPTATRTATATWTVTPTPSETPLPPTATPSPTNTPLPPTETPTETATVTPTPDPQSVQLQLEVFEQLWGVVNDSYLYPDFNGLDWQAVYSEYRTQIESGLDQETFNRAMDEMIDKLGDEHSSFFSAEAAAELDAEYASNYDYVGFGMMTNLVSERERITILLVFPNSPAETAGIQAHDSILAVDGQPLVDADGFHRELLLGPQGSQAILTVQTPGQAPREVLIRRDRINSSLPVPFQTLVTPQGQQVGYILLPTFNDRTVADQVGAALAQMSEQGPLDGLILDNRFNGGGSSDVLENTLAYFTDGVLGHFVRREQTRPLSVRGVDRAGSQNIPLVVLVGKNTASFGEIFAGVLSDIGRALLIGENSDGNVEILQVFNFPDGSRAWIAAETFRPLNQPEADWEKTGIAPDLIAPSAWDQTTLEDDPAIQAALDYFDQTR